MGRGKRAGLARLGVLGREIALSDSGRHLRVPPQLATSLVESAEVGEAARRGRWQVQGQEVQVYPEGSRRYVGSAVATKAWVAEAVNRDRPRVLHGRAYLEGEVAVLTDSFDNERARARVIDAHGHQLQLSGVGGAGGLLLGELFLQDAKVSATVFDRFGELRGIVKVKGSRGQRSRLDLRLAAVAAYFFLLEN